MNKKIVLVMALVLVFGGLGYGQSSNRPASVTVNAGSNTIPTAFDDSAGSLVLQNLTGNQYKNIKVLNEQAVAVSVLTIPEVSSAPAASVTGQRLHAAASTTTTFSNVSVFDNLYLKSEAGPISSGIVKITVW